MKLVTLLEKAPKMASEYVPRDVHYWHIGRAIRLATGALVIEIFLAIDSLTLRSVILSFRRFLDILFYVGLLASLERTTSILHASRGWFGSPGTCRDGLWKVWDRSGIRRGDWENLDRGKASIMHFEAGLGATILALLLALA